MATGRLGNQALAATTNTTVYTVPAGFYTVCTVSITNRNMTTVRFRLATSSTTTPSNQEWIEYDTVIVGNGVFERTGLVLEAGLNIVVYSDTASVGCTVFGIETSVV